MSFTQPIDFPSLKISSVKVVDALVATVVIAAVVAFIYFLAQLQKLQKLIKHKKPLPSLLDSESIHLSVFAEILFSEYKK